MEESVKTHPPINSLLLLILLIMVVVLPFFNIVWMIYMPSIWILFYIFYCRYCCIVIISYHTFEVRYFSPWLKSVSLHTQDITKLDYEKGGYGFGAKKTIAQTGKGGILYPYDRLILYQKNTEDPVVLNINTRIFDFEKILRWAAQANILVE